MVWRTFITRGPKSMAIESRIAIVLFHATLPHANSCSLLCISTDKWIFGHDILNVLTHGNSLCDYTAIIKNKPWDAPLGVHSQVLSITIIFHVQIDPDLNLLEVCIFQ